MKLVELLARELVGWPEGVACYAQDSTGSCYAFNKEEIEYKGNGFCEGWQGIDGMSIISRDMAARPTLQRATDYATTIVTREMWEVEKQRILSNCEGIIKEVVVEGTTLYNPIQSRDRIYEIDSLVESLEEERVSLVQGLEDEGFKLVGKGVKGDDCDQPAEYMSDPSNWNKGDIIEAVSESSGYKLGHTYMIKGFDSQNGFVFTEYDSLGSSTNGWHYRHFKFHSRPKV